MGPQAGFRPAGGPILVFQAESGRNRARKTDLGPEALLRSIGQAPSLVVVWPCAEPRVFKAWPGPNRFG